MAYNSNYVTVASNKWTVSPSGDAQADYTNATEAAKEAMASSELPATLELEDGVEDRYRYGRFDSRLLDVVFL